MHLRWLVLLGCLLSCYFPANHLFAQSASSIQEGSIQQKRPYQRFCRLLQGGDHNFYVVKGNMGSYWQFSPEGERQLDIIQLDQNLQAIHLLRLPSDVQSLGVLRILEVLPWANGIALVNLGKDHATKIPCLQLIKLDYTRQEVAVQVEKLGELPGASLREDRPQVRLSYSADSSTLLLAWRLKDVDEEGDASLQCQLFDRDLQKIKPPFLPFKQLPGKVMLRDILLLDSQHVIFGLQTLQATEGIIRPPTMAYGTLHYSIAQGSGRLIGFSNEKEIPAETRFCLNAQGQVIVAGWYLDQREDSLQAGLYIGRISNADTLEDLQRSPFPPEMTAALVSRVTRSGAVGLRSGFHSTLLPTAQGYHFVLHLRGAVNAGLVPLAPGKRANNTLHCWTFDPDFSLQAHTIAGFYNIGQYEYLETYSWRPVLLDGSWKAIATDFSQVRNEKQPDEAMTYIWSVSGADFLPIPIAHDPHNFQLAPREMVAVDAHTWVGIAVARSHWRLVKLEF